MTEGELRRLLMYCIPCVLQTGNAQTMAAWIGTANVANTISISRRDNGHSAVVGSDSVAESVDNSNARGDRDDVGRRVRGGRPLLRIEVDNKDIPARGDLDVAELEPVLSSLGDVGRGGRPNRQIEVENPRAHGGRRRARRPRLRIEVDNP